ncbi:hypothetical protein ACSBR1_016941 [Camellia fascicularis]
MNMFQPGRFLGPFIFYLYCLHLHLRLRLRLRLRLSSIDSCHHIPSPSTSTLMSTQINMDFNQWLDDAGRTTYDFWEWHGRRLIGMGKVFVELFSAIINYLKSLHEVDQYNGKLLSTMRIRPISVGRMVGIKFPQNPFPVVWDLFFNDLYELLFYPQYHLNQSSLLCRKPLFAKPVVMDVFQGYLLVTYRPFDVHIFHVKFSCELAPSSTPDLQLSPVGELSDMTAKSHPAVMRFIHDQLSREHVSKNQISTPSDLLGKETVSCGDRSPLQTRLRKLYFWHNYQRRRLIFPIAWSGFFLKYLMLKFPGNFILLTNLYHSEPCDFKYVHYKSHSKIQRMKWLCWVEMGELLACDRLLQYGRVQIKTRPHFLSMVPTLFWRRFRCKKNRWPTLADLFSAAGRSNGVIAELEDPTVSQYCALCLLQAELDESLYELAGELATDPDKPDSWAIFVSLVVTGVNLLTRKESHASNLMSGKELSKLVAFVKGAQFDLLEYLQRKRYGSACLENFASGIKLIGQKVAVVEYCPHVA